MMFAPHNPKSFMPAHTLETLVHSRIGRALRHLLLFSLLGSTTWLVVQALWESNFTVWTQEPTLLGLIFLGAALYIALRLLSFYFNYYYFFGLDSQLNETFHDTGFVYETAVLMHEGSTDVSAAFLGSAFGKQVCMRLGVAPSEMKTWTTSDERKKISGTQLPLPETSQITLKLFATALYQEDAALQQWLQSLGITDAMYETAVAWVYHDHLAYKRYSHRWSRDQLSRTRGIGSDFAFGHTYHLSKYTAPMLLSSVFSRRTGALPLRPDYLQQVETVLARGTGSNALLVGEAGVGKLDLLVALEENMQRGKALASITAKHFILLSGDRLVADFGKEKTELEHAIQRIFAEADAAGNVILVLKNLPALMKSVAAVGVDFGAIIEPFLVSENLQIVATAQPQSFHATVEHEGALLRQFELIQVEPTNHTDTITLIEELARTYEQKKRIVFTVQALEAIIADADRYLVHGVMPDKAIQLLDELASVSARSGMIIADTVHAFVNKKTGVPVGPVTDSERDTLLNLEAVLKERIVGQDAAVTAITGVMQRSRANITASDKPLGTLLFLGPTGVGKTETAKALAEVFFGNEEAMTRLDMSEYAGSDDISRLLGGNGHEGILANKLREHPYCVLLLDEFEKANEAVHNLFLQILDEGRFTDGHGQSVNARNTIIIATSNAGSELIREWVGNGTDLAKKKPELVDALIAQQLYRPELLNRFDEVVLYAPLEESQQRDVALLLLKDLQKRLKEQGHQLTINDALIDTVAEMGYEPAFGARPMRRVIQSVIEKKIAQKILAGTVLPGDTITLSKQELDR